MKYRLFASGLACLAILIHSGGAFAQGGAGGILVGFMRPDLAPLNRTMSAARYGKYSNDLPGFGGWGAFFGKRIWIGGSGWGFWQIRESSYARARLMGGSGFFDLGYIVAKPKAARLAGLVGIGGGGYTLELRPVAIEKNFGQILQSPGTSTRITSGQMVIKIGVQIDRYLATVNRQQTAGVVVGVRAEYFYALSDPEWKVEDTALLGAPDLRLEGLVVRLMLGFGGGR